MLYDIRPKRPHQESLFGRRRKQDEDLMEAVDRVNRKHGKGTVGLAAARLPKSDPVGQDSSTQKDWTMKRQNKSPRYTTRWDELPVAKA
jgi:DNA polymerase V